MTDRFHSLVVVLDADRRDDDCAALIQAIQQLKGVLSVSGNVADMNSHMAETRARMAMQQKMFNLFQEPRA